MSSQIPCLSHESFFNAEAPFVEVYDFNDLVCFSTLGWTRIKDEYNNKFTMYQ
jgi:hypothetical protein